MCLTSWKKARPSIASGLLWFPFEWALVDHRCMPSLSFLYHLWFINLGMKELLLSQTRPLIFLQFRNLRHVDSLKLGSECCIMGFCNGFKPLLGYVKVFVDVSGWLRDFLYIQDNYSTFHILGSIWGFINRSYPVVWYCSSLISKRRAMGLVCNTFDS